jgi:catechol 2,3-dioxygenase-like lactoylglutathione lyase family enzyme
MPFKFSRCICLQSPDANEAMKFYHTVMGLPAVARTDGQRELTASENRMFFDSGELRGPIMEFLVPDIEKAREELIAAGCTVVRWEGKGGCCYVQDPFGFWFNLWEEPEAFV